MITRSSRHPLRRAIAMVATAALAAVGWVGLSATPALAAPFDPAVPTFWIAQGPPTQLSEGIQVAGQVSFQPVGDQTNDINYNAVGFRQSDGYLYGISGTPGGDPAIARIDDAGVVTLSPVDLPTIPAGYPVGAFGQGALADRLLVTPALLPAIYVVNVDTGAIEERLTSHGPTVGTMVPNTSDWTAFGGYMWGGQAGGGYVVRVDPATGVIDMFEAAGLSDTGPYGAAWTYGNGNLALSDNQSGQIAQLRIDDPSSTSPVISLVSRIQGPDTQQGNDGANSPGDPTDLSVVKLGTPTVGPSGTITWDLTVTNNSATASSGFTLTDAMPAGVTNVQATGSNAALCTVSGLSVSCIGDPLPAGESATYSFTGTAPTEDATLVNTAIVSANEEDPDPSNNTDTSTTTVVVPVPHLAIAKSSDAGSAALPGQVITYTVTATNDGMAGYTTANPASLTDDLSDVLDDATWNNTATVSFSNGSTSAGPALSGNTLNWNGPLKAGETATITYGVTVTNAGNHAIVNNACVPNAGENPTCATTDTQLPDLATSKSVNPASGTVVTGGQALTYTLTYTNSGLAPAAVNDVDTLAGVLDDADITVAPAASDPSLTVTGITDGTFGVQGTVAAGATVRVSYQATVKPDSTRTGDNSLVNWLLPSGTEPPADCEAPLCTINPVPDIADSKSVDVGTGTTVTAGEVLTYTLTFTNSGTAAGTVDSEDILTHLLDDATLTSGPMVSNPALSAILADERIAVTGTLQPNQTVTVSYQATIRPDGERGDNQVLNFLLAPGAPVPPPVCDGSTGDCTYNPIPNVGESKTVNPASGTTVNVGQVLTYTLTFTNDGKAAGPVAKEDVLTDVLDDATLTSGPTSSNAALTAELDGDRLEITGNLAAGQTVTVTYAVTVKTDAARGNDSIANFLVEPGQDPPATCDPATGRCTVNPIPHIVDSKAVDPASGTTVLPGEVLTYTLTFENIGTGEGAVAKDDVLTQVLDDAALTSAPVSSDPAALTPTLTGDRISITGTLAAGRSVTVTYQVTVLPDGERGNDQIANYLLAPGVQPPAACEGDDCTINPIPHIVDSKSVDPASGSTVLPGEVLTYTLTFENIGTGAGAVAKDDVLTQVFDDATLTSAPVSSNPTALEATLTDERISVTGVVAAGQTVTVTYSVTVLPDAERGNDLLSNFLVAPGAEPPAECEGEDCTVNLIPRLVDSKTVDPESGSTVLPGDALTYTLTFQNIGTGAGVLTMDDALADVLDDATLTEGPTTSDPALAVALDGERLLVTGTLAAGQTVTVTYAVTVLPDADRGNDLLSNYLVAPGAEPPTECEGDDCTVNLIPRIVDAKSVDPESGTVVVTGEIVDYTLTFENAGTGAGSFAKEDVLTDVLDDATLIGMPISSDPAVTATIEGDRIQVAGRLEAGQIVTVTYSVVVNDDDLRGNSSLANYLVIPGSPPPAECEGVDCTVNPMPRIQDTKTVDPSTGTTVVEGDTLSYTLTFSNTGTAAGDVARDDDLADVLDDASLTIDPVTSDPALQADLDGDIIHVTGNLAAGQNVTVTYAVTVLPDEERGNNVIGNYIVRPGSEPPAECEIGNVDCSANPVPLIESVKSVDPASGSNVITGQVLTYTLGFANSGAATGEVDYIDVLTDVLDDADFVEGSLLASDELTATFDGAGIHVAGPLEVDQNATVTYQVVVRPAAERGNGVLGNFLVKAGDTPPDNCEIGEANCTLNPIPHLSVLKTSDASPTIKVGDTLVYEVTVTNDGTGDFTEENPATVSDDLSSVLDDATYNGDATATATNGSDPVVVYEEPILSWTGPLASGDSVVITYTVTTTGAGDLVVLNGACVPNAGEDASCAETTTGLADVDVVKSVDPASGTILAPGDTASYTLTITNHGTGAGAFSYTDHLADVLDDATITTSPAASVDSVTVTPIAADQFTAKGLLEADGSVTVSYSVTTKAWDAQGNHTLGNWVTETGTQPDATCPAGDTTCTTNRIQPALAHTGVNGAGLLAGSAALLLLAGLSLLIVRRRRQAAEA